MDLESFGPRRFDLDGGDFRNDATKVRRQCFGKVHFPATPPDVRRKVGWPRCPIFQHDEELRKSFAGRPHVPAKSRRPLRGKLNDGNGDLNRQKRYKENEDQDSLRSPEASVAGWIVFHFTTLCFHAVEIITGG